MGGGILNEIFPHIEKCIDSNNIKLFKSMHLQYTIILLTYFFHKINQGREVVTISIYKSITGETLYYLR